MGAFFYRSIKGKSLTKGSVGFIWGCAITWIPDTNFDGFIVGVGDEYSLETCGESVLRV